MSEFQKNAEPPSAIERLRRIRACLIASGAPDATWFAQGLAEYENGAPLGELLDDIFGLKGSRWWLVETRRRRDDEIGGIARDFFAGALSVRQRALKIASAFRRYRATAWLRDKTWKSPPRSYRGSLKERLFIVSKLGGGELGFSAIQRILSAGCVCTCNGDGDCTPSLPALIDADQAQTSPPSRSRGIRHPADRRST